MKASASRLRAAFGGLDVDQRFAAGAAAALLLTMLLPWYEKSVVVPGSTTFASDAISAFGAVSFVEAAIFLVAAGVLALVLTRAEGGRYHLPGGDGMVIFAAGLWASALIFYRVFDRPDVSGQGGTVGIQWGFFVAFVAAGALAFAGQRMRAAGRPEPSPREPRPRRTPPTPMASDWSDDGAELVPLPVRRTRPVTSSQERTAVVPASEAGTEVVARSEDRTDVVARSEDGTEIVPSEPRRPRDRAVRREDARLTIDDPPDAPLPGDAPRTRDSR